MWKESEKAVQVVNYRGGFLRLVSWILPTSSSIPNFSPPPRFSTVKTVPVDKDESYKALKDIKDTEQLFKTLIKYIPREIEYIPPEYAIQYRMFCRHVEKRIMKTENLAKIYNTLKGLGILK